MSKLINAKLVKKNCTLDEACKFANSTNYAIINSTTDVTSYAFDTGYIYISRRYYTTHKKKTDKIIKSSIPSRLFDCNLINADGYIRVSVPNIKEYRCHRIILIAFKGYSNDSNKIFVNHKDFDTGNNHLDNLEWVTQRENILYSVKNNRFPKHLNLSEDERLRRRIYGRNAFMKLHADPNYKPWNYGYKYDKDSDFVKRRKQVSKNALRDSKGRFCKRGDINGN